MDIMLDTDTNLEKAMMLGNLDIAKITQFKHRDFFEAQEFVKFEEHLVGHPVILQIKT